MSGIFSAPQPVIQQAAPAPKPPEKMPDVNGLTALEAKRRSQVDIMGRAGRMSTILSATKDRSSDYSATTLGAG